MLDSKIDVIINVFGKPWQTLCTLKSLLKVSGNYIDKIYLIEQPIQPYEENVKFILDEFDNLIHFIPNSYIFQVPGYASANTLEERYLFRYQYGIENSDKKFVFITHDDILYTSDIVGDMLNEIGDNVGIGKIGQCWNCPLGFAKLCNGNIFPKYDLTYDELIELCNIYPPTRQIHFSSRVDKEKPMPLPECRLNEFACLINKEITNKECFPNGDVHLFGCYNLDLADMWFRDLILKGYKFKNFDIDLYLSHGYFTSLKNEKIWINNELVNHPTTGYSVQLNKDLYIESEINAKAYYEKNFKNK